MTINLKIEIIKIFTFEFSLSSEKKKEEESVEETSNTNVIDMLQRAGKS